MLKLVLRNVDVYNEDVTVCNTIEELNRLLPEKKEKQRYSAMAMRSNYDINKLTPYSGKARNRNDRDHRA